MPALGPDLAAQASLLLVRLDRGLASDDPAAFLHAHGIIGKVVGTPGRRGFQVEPRHWKVAPAFGRLQCYRRLRVDDEASLDTSRHMTPLAALVMTGMRVQRAPHT